MAARNRRTAPGRTTPVRDRSPRESAARAVLERRIRALEEPLDVSVRRRAPFLLLQVRNPVRGTAYRVAFPAYPSRDAALCTCVDFARRGLGTCKHLAAAERWLAEHPDPRPEASESRLAGPDPARVWAEVDRRSAVPPPSARAAVRLRWPGGALLLADDLPSK